MTILVILVAIIGYLTFSTAAQLGDPGPSVPAADDPASRATSACERAVVDVIDHPERAIGACGSQAEIDAAYRTVFLEPPNWGRELSDACATDQTLGARPLCQPTAPPEPTPTEPLEPSGSGPGSASSSPLP